MFVATSLDGFIASSDGSVDWLLRFHARFPAGEDFGFARFTSSVDAMVMGRHTFEQVLTFPQWPYARMPVVVMTSGSADRIHQKMQELPADRRLPSDVSVSVSAGETPTELVDRLTQEGKRHLYIDGGLTVQSFLEAKLVDEITISTIPILLGSGKSLFSSSGRAEEQPLEHVETKAYELGLVQSKWRVIHSTPETQ